MKSTSGPKRASVSAPRPRRSYQSGENGSHVLHAGIHNRRDKRVPFRSGRIRPEDLEEKREYQQAQEPTPNSYPQWQEALMLWLSWNSTHEKLTARMCKPGQNQDKLEVLMDELDQLRSRAIALSEKLMTAPIS